MADWLADLWSNLTSPDVWVDWHIGKVASAELKPGLLDNRPLKEFLTNVLSRFEDYGRKVVLGATRIDTGQFVEFTNHNLEFSELPDASVSSASIPLVFPPHIWSKGIFMDGGTVYNLDAEGAVRACLDGIVDDPSKIIMDIYICGADEAPEVIDKAAHTESNFLRAH